ncbi:pyridoxamine 5'-phosphate oxidase family protein [Streptomyces sp. NPDC005318]|uniref:pyridoxamine 5'-phosphate oxidase family protein n=1 Tax=Streptomyces sp. NPDC005318 TaxID=3157031 RepID=UPI0033B30DCF
MQLEPGEALRLLGTVGMGRVIFSQHALPAARPVSHIVDGEDIVVRLEDGGALAALAAPHDAPGTVVAYEADTIDPGTRLGWSVVVTGYASLVPDSDDRRCYAELLRPWVEGPASRALRIRPRLVTGFRLDVEQPSPTDP